VIDRLPNGINISGNKGNKYEHMNFIGMITGLMALIQAGTTGHITANTVYQGAVMVDRAYTMSSQGTWNSSMQEEGIQMIKDILNAAHDR